MNSNRTLFFILLAWSATLFTAHSSTVTKNEPLTQIFSDLDSNFDVSTFALLWNEEALELPTQQNVDTMVNNMQSVLLGTLTHLMENMEESMFASVEVMEEVEFTLEESTAWSTISEESETNNENEMSFEMFATSSEEAQEEMTFGEEFSNNNVEALFEENDFFQNITPEFLELFNEELTSLFHPAELNLNANGEENVEELSLSNQEEANIETELIFADVVALPDALSGTAFTMVDGLNGLEGEEEKGEEDLEAKYNLVSAEAERFNVVNSGSSKSFDVYLGVLCIGVALFVIGAVAKGMNLLRKNENGIEYDTSLNYVQIHND